MAAASTPNRSPSGGKVPNNDFRSFLWAPEFRILVGVGLGYVARRLWAGPQDSLDSKLAQLRAAPTIHSASLNECRDIPADGKLVVIQNGVVQSNRGYFKIRPMCNDHYHNNVTGDVVVTRPVDNYKDQRQPNQHLCGVPFILTGGVLWNSLVVVKNVDADHLQLESRRTRPKWPTIEPARWVRYISTGTRLESVFGRLRKRNGVLEIEPSNEFPKECFTMTRSEIKRAVRAQAQADPNTDRVRRFSVGVGFVSFGFILNGLYSYAMNKTNP